MNRLNFLKQISSLFGISIITTYTLESCNSNELDEDQNVLTEDEIIYNDLKNKTTENGKYLDGRILYVDITHDNFSSLNTVGEFVNDYDNYILILRKSDDLFQTFSNCCPHLGTFNQWSYSNGSFRCSNHGNRYGTANGAISNCGSGRTSGNLKQYVTTINQDILIVDFEG
ncbi:MAG: Rieske 2Fe-2S domain-containing protein [Wenyingzhuangia sp.]|uniref:Rieske 2Fe-2S domain-containing protein n=1 Tax=Wenyingzhuangia sp. TaxID=1964193 RepID=UPI00321A710D